MKPLVKYVGSLFVRKESILSLLLILATFYQLYGSSTTYQLLRNQSVYNNYGERVIYTAEGWLTYDYIEKKIFEKLGYKILKSTVPVPTLEYIDPPFCKKVFRDWLSIAQDKAKWGPDEQIPERLEREYTLDGYVRLYRDYHNNKEAAKEKIWDQIDKWRNYDDDRVREFVNYKQSGMALFYALNNYAIGNQKGLVIGSVTPWAEALALRRGASRVLTLDYQPITIIANSEVDFAHPIDFAKNWNETNEKFDFAISFSSIEHSGLGRYGDSFDSIGDLREIQKIHCSLKPGGLLFLGLPRGQDAVVYNAHRIYGRIRLAMMMTSFEWLATYRGSSVEAVNVTLHDLDGQNSASGELQDVFVLRKV